MDLIVSELFTITVALRFPVVLFSMFSDILLLFLALEAFLAKQIVWPLSIHIVRFALFVYIGTTLMRLTLIPIRDS